MALRRSSHAFFDCQYHLAWATKYRKRVLTLSHEREYCEKVLRRTASEYGMSIRAMEVDEDHVHVYIDIPPQRSIGRAVGILKSVRARLAFKRFAYLRRKLWGGELWNDSYFARTVGEGVTAALVRKYIEEHAGKGLPPAQGDIFPKGKVSRSL